ncbi:hypothetical protein PTSG_05556 [Salpingoeca rosetta]|uniref:Uncharacterized protein n=1 Tax=Salpingoeca rosetta (strain ATCC 50818 / BSB-021) TaxID=946362 RepID=F2UBJ5_SALR5|nr:uncharacterized protein PTSG_05556 [Salpingoeca rosetta]EGD73861.1 hypothetical protein PTSG_05556 [Salpingoeca rosetta]|eukprot:XP_004993424.1 hypothetical protein PTSG_05556 [Salpingoeca rosetta]
MLLFECAAFIDCWVVSHVTQGWLTETHTTEEMEDYLGKRSYEESSCYEAEDNSAQQGPAAGEKRSCEQGFSWWTCMMYSMPQQEVVVSKKTGNLLQ